jgi:hypothetical protein
MKVGDLRLIPKGTVVWSVSLQENVSFERDIPIKITNTIYNNDEYFYGILQLELFNHMIPGAAPIRPWKEPGPDEALDIARQRPRSRSIRGDRNSR